MNYTILVAGIAFSVMFLGTLAFDDAEAAVFAKYDGIDGEAKDEGHKDWINLLSFDWEANQSTAASGQSRRRGSAVVEDIRMTMEFEKSTPKLLEKMNLGEVIPKLEIELTRVVPCVEPPRDPSGEPIPGEMCEVVYLRYELKNVRVTSYSTSTGEDLDERPQVVLSNNFEEIKITYTEYDSEGNKGGNAETTWKVEKGEK